MNIKLFFYTSFIKIPIEIWYILIDYQSVTEVKE